MAGYKVGYFVGLRDERYRRVITRQRSTERRAT
jgi:hypothetical protein